MNEATKKKNCRANSIKKIHQANHFTEEFSDLNDS